MTSSERPSRVERTEKRVDQFLARIARSRRESISRSMMRPLRTELARTGFIVACVLLDLVLVPIALATILGDLWAYVVLFALFPLAYGQYLLHERLFPGKALQHETSSVPPDDSRT